MSNKSDERFNRYYFRGRTTVVVDQADPNDFKVGFAFCSPLDSVDKKRGRKIANARISKRPFPIPRTLVKEQKGLYRAMAYILQGLFAKTNETIHKDNAEAIKANIKNLSQMAPASLDKDAVLDFAEAKIEKQIREAVYSSLHQSLHMPYWFLREMLRVPVIRQKNVNLGGAK